MIIILLMISFLPFLAGLFLCPIVAINSCKQSQSNFGFCVVQLWPTFNGLNFELISNRSSFSLVHPCHLLGFLIFKVARSIFGLSCFRQKCRKCNICYLLGMSFSTCGEKPTADFSAIETFLK